MTRDVKVLGGPGSLTRALIAAASWYCRASPFDRGKTRLQELFTKGILRGKSVWVESEYGTCFRLKFPEDQAWHELLFQRTFEAGTTRCLLRLLRPDDVVVDAGANIGWYTFLFARFLTGGECHAFEPLPSLFYRLDEARSFNEVRSRLFLNRQALGAQTGRAELHTFRELHHGLTSLSTLGRNDFEALDVEMETLDAYVERQKIRRVNIVKLDVEGAELAVLQGGQNLLRSERPPVFVMEMNIETSAAFGYHPRELVQFLTDKAPYEFFRVCAARGEVLPMQGPGDFVHGDNVVAVPSGEESLRAAVLPERNVFAELNRCSVPAQAGGPIREA